MARRRAKNLLLSIEVLEAAEAYAKAHRTTVSRLVGDFLGTLPVRRYGSEPKSPIVQRLRHANYPGYADADHYANFTYAAAYRRWRKRLDQEIADYEYRNA